MVAHREIFAQRSYNIWKVYEVAYTELWIENTDKI